MSLTALSDAVCFGDQTATAQAKQDIIILCTKFYVKFYKDKIQTKNKTKINAITLNKLSYAKPAKTPVYL